MAEEKGGLRVSTLGKHWTRDVSQLPQCQPRPCPIHGPKARGFNRSTKLGRVWRCPGCEADRHIKRKLAGTAPGYGPRKKKGASA